MSLFAVTLSDISAAILGLIPLISASLSGSCSIILSVSALNLLTILEANAAPIPFTAPEARYLSTDFSSSGGMSSQVSTLSCWPYTACSV